MRGGDRGRGELAYGSWAQTNWIIDPFEETITVLVLDGPAYREVGVFARGAQATSLTLDGALLDVSAILDAE